MLPHALHSLALQLDFVGCDDTFQHAEIGVDEQCVVHDATVAGAVEGGSGDLLTVEQNVVAPRDGHGNTDAMQCVGSEAHAVGKHLLYVRLTADEGEHDVALIGVDTAATAFAA